MLFSWLPDDKAGGVLPVVLAVILQIDSTVAHLRGRVAWKGRQVARREGG